MTSTVASTLLARVSAPGKLILMGEHAAVYGRPALTAAIGLRLRVDLHRSGDPGVELDLAALGHHTRLDWDRVLDYADDMRRRWRLYADDPTRASFAALRDDDPARLAIIALGEAVAALDHDPRQADSPLAALRVRVDSELPVGAGFGSSAAAAVALVTACHVACGRRPQWSDLEGVVLEVERRQHGLPSGVDGATSFHGGVLRARKSADSIAHGPLQARPGLLRGIRVFDTGSPPDSTGDVVAAVRDGAEATGLAATLDRMEGATQAFDVALTGDDDDAAALIEPIREYQRCLETIGVVPAAVRELVAAVERAGGAAKISGAGSLMGPGAGSLLVVLPEADDDGPRRLRAAREIAAPLGVEGVRVEVTS